MFTLKVDDDISLMLHDMYDLEPYFYLIKNNRDHIAQYMDWPDNHQVIDDTRNYILYARQQFGEQKEITTKIYYRGEMVGSIGILIRSKEFGHGEIGYWLSQGAVGKGIITRAARAMTDYGFTTRGLHKILIRAMLHNERSIAVAKRLGYKHQGVDVHATMHFGEYYDFDTYYMLEDDWTPTLNQPEFSHQVNDKTELRVLEPHHAAALFNVTDANRDFVGRWIPPVKNNTSVKDTENFIQHGLNQYAERNGMQMGIWYEGQVCGACGYHYWDFDNLETEIGYWLAESHTGKGIMTQSVKHLIDYAFDVQGLHRVIIRCADDNEKSAAIPERLGFKLDEIRKGAEKLNEQYHDQRVYSMNVHDWKRKQIS